MVKEAIRKLEPVAEDVVFKTKVGDEIRSLEELMDKLISMDKETFRHHVNSQKNDFSTWIRDVIKDDELAESLLTTTDQLESQKLVRNRIIELKEKIHKAKKDPAYSAESINNDINPAEILKQNVHSILYGIIIGIILGLFIGFILGMMM